MVSDDLSFPRLKRRACYSVKPNGSYYDYGHYREEIRQDSVGRCVYCDAHENELGGQEAMELDHFRPKKYPEHSHLVNDPNNLVWSCRGCNRLKSDHWPALGTDSAISNGQGFFDPFCEDRRDYFLVLENGEFVPLTVPAKYMLMLLVLNRPSRQRLRESRTVICELCEEIDRQAKIIGEVLSTELSDYQRALLQQVFNTLSGMASAIPQRFVDFRLR